jgi:radical SAM superfamily enzyme YgiQ (UPF0313 family)
MLTDVLTKCLKDNPDAGLIGLGGLATDYAFLKDAIGIIRANSKIPIVLGGQIVTNDAEFIYENLKPDYAVVGEGESAIVALAQPSYQPNIIESKEWQVDDIPFPDYTPFGIDKMMDDYSEATRVLYRYTRPYPRVWGIVTARSCPFSCTFCIHGKRSIPYRARSIPNIMAEIKETYDKYHYNVLLILDELFATNKERMNEFSNAILDGKANYGWDFDWTFQTHASAKFDLDSLKLAKKAGCYMFSYGLESASPTVLESMNKKIKIEQVIEAIAMAKEAKLGISGNLIFGDPAETDETIRESLCFYLKYCKDAFIFLSVVYPYPGSKIFDDCVERNIILDKAGFYANIDKSLINMTTIPTHDYVHRIQQLMMIEKGWLLTASTSTDRWEEDVAGVSSPLTPFEGKPYKIAASCPHCHEEIVFRQRLSSVARSFFIGVGCPKCGLKFRLDVVV